MDILAAVLPGNVHLDKVRTDTDEEDVILAALRALGGTSPMEGPAKKEPLKAVEGVERGSKGDGPPFCPPEWRWAVPVFSRMSTNKEDRTCYWQDVNRWAPGGELVRSREDMKARLKAIGLHAEDVMKTFTWRIPVPAHDKKSPKAKLQKLEEDREKVKKPAKKEAASPGTPTVEEKRSSMQQEELKGAQSPAPLPQEPEKMALAKGLRPHRPNVGDLHETSLQRNLRKQEKPSPEQSPLKKKKKKNAPEPRSDDEDKDQTFVPTPKKQKVNKDLIPLKPELEEFLKGPAGGWWQQFKRALDKEDLVRALGVQAKAKGLETCRKQLMSCWNPREEPELDSFDTRLLRVVLYVVDEGHKNDIKGKSVNKEELVERISRVTSPKKLKRQHPPEKPPSPLVVPPERKKKKTLPVKERHLKSPSEETAGPLSIPEECVTLEKEVEKGDTKNDQKGSSDNSITSRGVSAAGRYWEKLRDGRLEVMEDMERSAYEEGDEEDGLNLAEALKDMQDIVSADQRDQLLHLHQKTSALDSYLKLLQSEAHSRVEHLRKATSKVSDQKALLSASVEQSRQKRKDLQLKFEESVQKRADIATQIEVLTQQAEKLKEQEQACRQEIVETVKEEQRVRDELEHVEKELGHLEETKNKEVEGLAVKQKEVGKEREESHKERQALEDGVLEKMKSQGGVVAEKAEERRTTLEMALRALKEAIPKVYLSKQQDPGSKTDTKLSESLLSAYDRSSFLDDLDKAVETVCKSMWANQEQAAQEERAKEEQSFAEIASPLEEDVEIHRDALRVLDRKAAVRAKRVEEDVKTIQGLLATVKTEHASYKEHSATLQKLQRFLRLRRPT